LDSPVKKKFHLSICRLPILGKSIEIRKGLFCNYNSEIPNLEPGSPIINYKLICPHNSLDLPHLPWTTELGIIAYFSPPPVSDHGSHSESMSCIQSFRVTAVHALAQRAGFFTTGIFLAVPHRPNRTNQASPRGPTPAVLRPGRYCRSPPRVNRSWPQPVLAVSAARPGTQQARQRPFRRACPDPRVATALCRWP